MTSKTEPTPEQLTAVQELASQLCGTCGTAHEQNVADDPKLAALVGVDDGDIGIWLETHGEIFLCATCGWWCESSEMCDSDNHNGEQVCAECGGEE